MIQILTRHAFLEHLYSYLLCQSECAYCELHYLKGKAIKTYQILATALEFVYILTAFYFRRDTSWRVEVADDFLLPTHFLCCCQSIYIIW